MDLSLLDLFLRRRSHLWPFRSSAFLIPDWTTYINWVILSPSLSLTPTLSYFSF